MKQRQRKLATEERARCNSFPNPVCWQQCFAG